MARIGFELVISQLQAQRALVCILFNKDIRIFVLIHCLTFPNHFSVIHVLI